MRNLAFMSAVLLAGMLTFGCKPGQPGGEMNIATLRAEVVQEIGAQKILAGQTGLVALPASLEKASVGGSIYISQDQNHGWTVIFVNNPQSQASSERGSLYCERAIPRGTQQVQVAGLSWRLDRPANPNVWMVTRVP
jgi:hypothetical protein